MTGLLRAEFLRAFSRRLFRLLGALALLGLLIAVVITFIQSSNDPESGLAEARRRVAGCEAQREQFEREQTEDGPQFFECPSVEEIRQFHDKRFIYAQSIPDTSRGIAVALFAMSFLVGASFMGAEWGTNVMTTLLVWETRRSRVLIAKFVAIVVIVAVAAALFLALMAVVFVPVASLRGVTDGMTRSMWWELSGIWLRGAGVAAFGSAIGLGLATIFRNTAGAMGVGFVYGVILDPLLGFSWEGRFQTWLLQHLIPRLLGVPLAIPQRAEDGFMENAGLMVLSVSRPIVLFALYAAGLLGLAYLSFRARDVT